MGYDFFTQPKGYDVDVNLIPNAMKAGAQVGNEIPSDTKAAIDGLLGGIKTGESLYSGYQNIEEEQHKLDRQPVTDAIQDEQLKSDQNKNTLNDMTIQRDQLTKKLQDDNATLTLQSQNSQLEQQAKDNDTKKRVSALLANPNPQVKMSILDDPDARRLMQDHNYAEPIYGQLSQYMTAEQRDAAYRSVDFSKAMETERKTKAAEDALNQKAGALLDKDFDKMSEDGVLRGMTQGKSYSDVAQNFEVFPRGQKQLITGTNTLNRDATDNDMGAYTEANGFDVFYKGEKLPYSATKDQAGRIFSFQDSWKRAIGGTAGAQKAAAARGAPAPSTETSQSEFGGGMSLPDGTGGSGNVQTSGPQKPQFQASSNGPAPDPAAGVKVRDMAELTKTLNQQAGLDQEETSSFLQAARNDGYNRPAVRRFGDSVGNMIHSITPKFLQSGPEDTFQNVPVSSGIGDTGQEADVRSLANHAADKLTADTLTKYEAASPEDKAQMDQWAKDNDVTFNQGGLRRHFQEQAVRALGTGYQEMYQQGIDEAAATKRADNAKRALQEEAAQKSSLAGKPMPDLATLHQTATTVTQSYGLGAAQSKSVSATVQKVAAHPLLADQTPELQAFAAVESAGNPRAISPTGVKGLLQVTQATAGRYGLDRDIPEQQVAAAQLYIDDLKTMFKGNEDLAYASYNAGEATVRYAQSLAANPNDWGDVKRHMYEAIVHMKNRGSLPSHLDAGAKLKEVFNYPEKIQMYKEIFA